MTAAARLSADRRTAPRGSLARRILLAARPLVKSGECADIYQAVLAVRRTNPELWRERRSGPRDRRVRQRRAYYGGSFVNEHGETCVSVDRRVSDDYVAECERNERRLMGLPEEPTR